MDKKIRIIAIIAVIIFSVFVLTSPSDPIPLPLPLSTSNSESDSVSILAKNLDKPLQLLFLMTEFLLQKKMDSLELFKTIFC